MYSHVAVGACGCEQAAPSLRVTRKHTAPRAARPRADSRSLVWRRAASWLSGRMAGLLRDGGTHVFINSASGNVRGEGGHMQLSNCMRRCAAMHPGSAIQGDDDAVQDQLCAMSSGIHACVCVRAQVAQCLPALHLSVGRVGSGPPCCRRRGCALAAEGELSAQTCCASSCATGRADSTANTTHVSKLSGTMSA